MSCGLWCGVLTNWEKMCDSAVQCSSLRWISTTTITYNTVSLNEQAPPNTYYTVTVKFSTLHNLLNFYVHTLMAWNGLLRAVKKLLTYSFTHPVTLCTLQQQSKDRKVNHVTRLLLVESTQQCRLTICRHWSSSVADNEHALESMMRSTSG